MQIDRDYFVFEVPSLEDLQEIISRCRIDKFNSDANWVKRNQKRLLKKYGESTIVIHNRKVIDTGDSIVDVYVRNIKANKAGNCNYYYHQLSEEPVNQL